MAGLPSPGKPFLEEVARVEGVDLLDQRERDAVVELLTVMVRRARSGDAIGGSDASAAESTGGT